MHGNPSIKTQTKTWSSKSGRGRLLETGKVFIIQQIPKLPKEQSMQWVDYLSLCKTKSNYVCRKHWRQNTNRFFKRRRLRLSGGGIRGNTFRAKLYLITFIFTPADFLRKRCVIKLMEIALDFLASFAGKPIYSVYMWVFVVTFKIDCSH